MLPQLSEADLSLSIVTYGEIYEGIYFGTNRRLNEAGFEAFLRWVDELPLTTGIMQRFARIRGELRRSGQILDALDLLIAATALEHDLTVVSRNIRHFGRIPRLRILSANPE